MDASSSALPVRSYAPAAASRQQQGTCPAAPRQTRFVHWEKLWLGLSVLGLLGALLGGGGLRGRLGGRLGESLLHA